MLISIDTLRSDRLPAYGYEAGSTPALDALRTQSVLFRHAYSPIPLTLPAHVSLLTGLLPPEHGVRDNLGYPPPAGLPTYLPDVLRAQGYRTGAAISAYPLSKEVGFGAGFDFFEDSKQYRPELGAVGLERPGGETLDLALPWLREAAASDQPFFFFFHIYEPHRPYEPTEPFASRLADPYDGEVALADAIVGRLFESLRAFGAYDETWIFLLSDHGEGLGDHGEEEHGLLLYREALQVPLIVKPPLGDTFVSEVEPAVQLTDVAPTVFDLLGIAWPKTGSAGPFAGRSLLPLLRDKTGSEGWAGRDLYAETYFPRIHLGWSELRSVIRGNHHYLEAPSAADPSPEIYDLIEDPRQQNNLLAQERRKVGLLRQSLAGLESRFEGPGAADEDDRQALASLGYVSSGASAGSGPLRHPKQGVEIFESFKLANEAFDAGQFERAAELYRRTVEGDPSMIAAWVDLGRSLVLAERLEASLEPFAEAIARGDDPMEAAQEAWTVFRRLNRPAEALAFLETAQKQHPAEVRLRFLRGRTFLLLGRNAEGLAEAEAAVAMAPRNADSLYFRGVARLARGELGAAEEDFRQALLLDPEHTPSMGDLAGLHSRRGEWQEARQLLRQIVALRPDDTAAAANLARLEARLAQGSG